MESKAAKLNVYFNVHNVTRSVYVAVIYLNFILMNKKQ